VRYFLKRQTYPLRLLLYLEWMLFTITILTKFHILKLPPPPPIGGFRPSFGSSPFSFVSILSLIAFGAIGLWFPKKIQFKIIHTALGFILIALAAFAGNKNINFFPALLLIMVIRGCLSFKLPGSLIVAGISCSGFLISLFLSVQNSFDRLSVKQLPVLVAPGSGLRPKILRHPDFNSFNEEELKSLIFNMALNTTILFCLISVFVLLLVNALISEHRSRQELAIANEQLRNYALLNEDRAMLQERNRIAREIHDSLGHSLTAQSIQLANAILFLRSNIDKAEKFLQEAKELGSDTLQQVRYSVATLRSDPLKGKLLKVAIAELVEDLQRRTEIIPNYSIALPDVLSKEITTTVYRIVQEALTNIIKHSEATEVNISLSAIDRCLKIQIEDNGNGFEPQENMTGFGIQGMRERTTALGGKFYLDSSLGKGCKIIAKIPLTSPDRLSSTNEFQIPTNLDRDNMLLMTYRI
jgi:signal transduction histidine kinase